MNPLLTLVAVLALLAAVPHARAQDPLEIDLLEAYLAEHDTAPATPHCARHSGHATVPGHGPVALPMGGTNAILVEHKAFHVEHGDGPGHVPSTDDADRYGDVFLGWHEDFIGAYQAWRERAGHPPLEAWDPGTPMPPRFAYDFPGRGCVPGRSSDPQAGFPTWATFEGGEDADPLFGHVRLCDFADLNQFGKSMSMSWHVEFHGRIGGDSRVGEGPRDPAFWAAHLYLIEHTRAYEEGCTDEGEDALGTAATTREVPQPALLPLLSALAALVLARRR